MNFAAEVAVNIDRRQDKTFTFAAHFLGVRLQRYLGHCSIAVEGQPSAFDTVWDLVTFWQVPFRPRPDHLVVFADLWIARRCRLPTGRHKRTSVELDH